MSEIAKSLPEQLIAHLQRGFTIQPLEPEEYEKNLVWYSYQEYRVLYH